MPKAPKHKRTALAQTIRRFRIALGETQQQFATRLGLSLTSVARYETNFSPATEVLEGMADIARAEGLPKFAELFEQSIPEYLDTAQDFAAVKELLRRRADTLKPDQFDDAVLALAFLSDSPILKEKLESDKQRLLKRYDTDLQIIDDEIDKWADDNYLLYPQERAARVRESFKTFEAASPTKKQ